MTFEEDALVAAEILPLLALPLVLDCPVVLALVALVLLFEEDVDAEVELVDGVLTSVLLLLLAVVYLLMLVSLADCRNLADSTGCRAATRRAARIKIPFIL